MFALEAHPAPTPAVHPCAVICIPVGQILPGDMLFRHKHTLSSRSKLGLMYVTSNISDSGSQTDWTDQFVGIAIGRHQSKPTSGVNESDRIAVGISGSFTTHAQIDNKSTDLLFMRPVICERADASTSRTWVSRDPLWRACRVTTANTFSPKSYTQMLYLGSDGKRDSASTLRVMLVVKQVAPGHTGSGMGVTSTTLKRKAVGATAPAPTRARIVPAIVHAVAAPAPVAVAPQPEPAAAAAPPLEPAAAAAPPPEPAAAAAPPPEPVGGPAGWPDSHPTLVAMAADWAAGDHTTLAGRLAFVDKHAVPVSAKGERMRVTARTLPHKTLAYERAYGFELGHGDRPVLRKYLAEGV